MTSEDIKTRNKLALITNLENLIREIKLNNLIDSEYEFNVPKDTEDTQKFNIKLEFKTRTSSNMDVYFMDKHPVLLKNDLYHCSICEYNINGRGRVKQCPQCSAKLDWENKVQI